MPLNLVEEKLRLFWKVLEVIVGRKCINGILWNEVKLSAEGEFGCWTENGFHISWVCNLVNTGRILKFLTQNFSQV